MAQKFIIQDWTGKTLFDGKTFDSFDEGWAFIYENVPNEGEGTYDDYYVEPVKPDSDSSE